MIDNITLDNKQTKNILTVSQLNHAIRDLLEQHYPQIWLEGEISNLALPHSGHWYFSLKDSNSQVRCAMFRGANHNIPQPDNGDQVLVRAKVSLYPNRGDYQLIINHLEPAGLGKLQQAFLALKQKLEKQGWFDPSHKQPIPQLPNQIGIITSPTGAAIRDVLTTLARRFPSIPIIIYPTEVQGATAHLSISKAINRANQDKICDVLLLVRGGGSLEDLWGFNEEVVAEAIVNSKIPIVSGVGHEVDVTIADLVADLRAPTPTAAAEAVTPDQTDWRARLLRLTSQLARQFNWILQNQTQQLDYVTLNLQTSIKHHINQAKHRLLHTQQPLNQHHPLTQIQRTQTQLSLKHQAIIHLINTRLEKALSRFNTLTQTLNAISPLNTLNRGYSITQNKQGKVIKSATEVSVGEQLSITLHEGELNVAVDVMPKSDGDMALAT